MSQSCCGTCGQITLANQVAINKEQESAFLGAACSVPTPCPECQSSTTLDPNLFAFCDEGTCRGADIRTAPQSACTTDDDCTLRNGTACCETCLGDLGNLFAVNKSIGLSSSVCAPDKTCKDCMPSYPLQAWAICSNGHCQVAVAGQGG
ncbi:Hypothetical protein A7982_07051 [Minicystis rosea]|nr:Hypothetical protein A7982_07051 [Minicystis rosea]